MNFKKHASLQNTNKKYTQLQETDSIKLSFCTLLTIHTFWSRYYVKNRSKLSKLTAAIKCLLG